jgi:hypothetical protein
MLNEIAISPYIESFLKERIEGILKYGQKEVSMSKFYEDLREGIEIPESYKAYKTKDTKLSREIFLSIRFR